MSNSESYEYIVIGDPHLTHKSYDKINQLFDIVEKMPQEKVIWLGDFLDTKEIIRGKCLNLLKKRFTNSEKQHIIIVGNHDYFNLDCEEHSLEVFKDYHPHITIVDKLTKIDGMWFMPYMHDQVSQKGKLDVCSTNEIIFGHFDVIGFDYGNGYVADAGLRHSDFKRFKRCISGHYHKYQERGNLVYLGTPFSHSFGESGQSKYIGIYNRDEDKLSLVPTPFEQHFTTEVNCDETNVGPLLNNKDLHRVILKGSKENIALFKKETLPEGTKVIERPDMEEMAIVIDEVDNNFKQFRKWAGDVKSLDTQTIQLGIEILEDNE